MSIRSTFVSTFFLRPNKILYRLFHPSPSVIRFVIHPQTWFWGNLLSPFGVRLENSHYGKIPGVIFTPKKNTQQNIIFVYLHGGGYCIGSSRTTHRIGLSNLAKTTSCIIHSIDYRLAPTHPYPAALDDATEAWKAIVADNPESQIILSGDSAGGGLSLALMMRLRDEGFRLPDAAVLFSPWADLTCSSKTYKTLAKADPMIHPAIPNHCAGHYVPDSVDRNSPYVSPIFGDFKGLPRTLILVGGKEILLDDSRIVGEHAVAAGADFEVDIWPNMFHDWWLFGPFIPETKQCLLKVADWIHSRE
ncbi:MAG: alpha/beta hydrolase [Candidatus Thalassarchaeaceae archaeon]|nr:alpha/beta hydrolase [Candidatus Thalassarchaeaceae archaeon]